MNDYHLEIAIFVVRWVAIGVAIGTVGLLLARWHLLA